MKKLLLSRTIAVVLLLSVSIYGTMAQSPDRFSYQAVIRNSSGVLVANQGVGIKISILQGTPTGTLVYQEIFNPNPLTNENGLVTLEIGGGIPIAGTMSSIDWNTGPYFLKSEIDPTGATSYTISGTSQLLSVPYALHARTATAYTETDPVFLASPAGTILAGSVANWNTAYSWGNHAVAGYVPGSRSLTINGMTLDLSTNRFWNVGTITSIAAGTGMNFTTITGTGTITMGTPSTLTPTTINSVFSTTHTHALSTQLPSGTTSGLMVHSGVKTAGGFYGGTTTPSASNRANYDGYLYATRFYGDGSNLTALSADALTSGIIPVGRGGTGASSLAANKVLIGNGTNAVITHTNLHWDNTNARLGIGTATPSANLHVYGTGTGAGNVLFTGSYKSTPGNPPASGAGTRFMWYPDKAALRAGYADGAEWDKDSIGSYSVGFGRDVRTDGNYSFATGSGTKATNHCSFASGGGSDATGQYSTAMGWMTLASGGSSLAVGTSSVAGGSGSVALGVQNIASGNYAVAMGFGSRAVGAASYAINLTSSSYGPEVGANTFRISGATSIGGNLAWTNFSDSRLKKDVAGLSGEGNLEKIMKLNGVRFRWIDNDQLLNLGFLAQDVAEILPESVRYDKESDIYMMEYTAIIPVLVEAIKEQQQQIETLKSENAILKQSLAEIEALKEAIRELKDASGQRQVR